MSSIMKSGDPIALVATSDSMFVGAMAGLSESSSPPNSGVLEFLQRQEVLPFDQECDNDVISSDSASVATRSMSAVVIQVEEGSKDVNPLYQNSFKTPMSNLLSSTISQDCSLKFYKDVDNVHHTLKQKRFGPEQFIEMLRKKTIADQTPLISRRRTVSENQGSLFHKFAKHSKARLSEIFLTSCNIPLLPGNLRIHNFSDRKQRNSLCDDSMINFPKVNFGSTSPLNEFCQFASSPSEPLVIWKEPNEEDRIIKVLGNDDTFEKVSRGGIHLEKMIENILRLHTAYDAMPSNARCIVLDLELKVGSAFDALTYDGIHAAPLWDDNSKSFVGMLTMTDFISILQQYLDQPEVLSAIRDDRVSKWRDRLLDSDWASNFPDSDCLLMSVDSKLEEVFSHLLTNKVHRVVVVDPITNDALYVATYRQILKYLWSTLPSFGKDNVRVLNGSLEELKVGSYNDLVSVSLETTVSEVFFILLSRRLSSVPIVDEDFRVVEVFRRADVMSLILDGSFDDLYSPVREVLAYRRNGFEGLYSCRKSHSLLDVITSMVVLNLHRVVVVDDDGKLEGVVSLSDVVRFIVDPERMTCRDS